MRKIICALILCLLISCDKGLEQFTEWITGNWEFNDKIEYIHFMSDAVFIMNDSIQGHYEISDETDTDIFYYYISKTGLTEGYGYMEVLSREKKSALVKDLPIHEGDTIKIFKR